MKKIAIVTGASSGIGREFALQLDKAEKFDEMWIIARRTERLCELEKLLSCPVRPISLDLVKRESLNIFKELLEVEKPDVRVLVNAAGFGKFGSYRDVALNDSLDMIDLNSRAPVAITELTLPYMTEGARIIEVCSIAGFNPLPYMNVYAASKVFLLNYSRALNFELRDRKITVTALCPCWTKTEFFDVATDGNKKKEVTNYMGMRTAEEMVRKALSDSLRGKSVSVKGAMSAFHRFGAKIVPYGAVMKIWNKIRK